MNYNYADQLFYDFPISWEAAKQVWLVVVWSCWW